VIHKPPVTAMGQVPIIQSTNLPATTTIPNNSVYRPMQSPQTQTIVQSMTHQPTSRVDPPVMRPFSQNSGMTSAPQFGMFHNQMPSAQNQQSYNTGFQPSGLQVASLRLQGTNNNGSGMQSMQGMQGINQMGHMGGGSFHSGGYNNGGYNGSFHGGHSRRGSYRRTDSSDSSGTEDSSSSSSEEDRSSKKSRRSGSRKIKLTKEKETADAGSSTEENTSSEDDSSSSSSGGSQRSRHSTRSSTTSARSKRSSTYPKIDTVT
jgi:hypothetical protein